MQPVARTFRGPKPSVGLGDFEPTLTVQASKDETDINHIVNRYLRTGVLPEVNQGIYADISELTDLRDAIHLVNDAQQAFLELPAEIRRRFDNDPVKLVEFAQNPNNQAEAYAMGLAQKPPSPAAPAPVPSAQEAPKPPAGTTTT